MMNILGKVNWSSFLIALYALLTLMSRVCIYMSMIPYWQITMFFVLFICMIKDYEKLRFKKNIQYFLLFIFVWNLITFATHNRLYFQNSGVSITFTAIVFFYLQNINDRCKTVQYFIFLTTIVLFLGLVEYIFFLANFKIVLSAGVERGEGSNEYLTMTLFNVISESSLVHRFQGLFREPGHVGVTAGILMFSLPKINKKLWILWLTFGLFSLSLAFYVLLFISIIINMINKPSKKVFISISSVVILVILGYYTIDTIKQVVDSNIVDRSEEYISEGYDNRAKDDLIHELSHPHSSFDSLFGYGDETFVAKGYNWGNTGIRADLYKYGIVGVILISISILFLLKTKNNYLFVALLFAICYYNGNIPFALYFHLAIFSFAFAPCFANIFNLSFGSKFS